jgi:hypothetical protein
VEQGGGGGAEAALKAPIIVEWIVQWKFPVAVFNEMAALDAPGLMSPTTVPSSSTMWCSTVVLFVHTT